MTKDVQHDRTDSPLASVSDEIYPIPPTLMPPSPADPAPTDQTEDRAPSDPFNCFEGFGSFS